MSVAHGPYALVDPRQAGLRRKDPADRLAEAASESLGIPRRHARRLAETYLTRSAELNEGRFLRWIGGEVSTSWSGTFRDV
jgi:hypothetical protein